jgi:hypothetical protein
MVMDRATLKSRKQSSTLFMAVLIRAAASIAALMSGCGTTVLIHDCPDAGAQDGGGGAGGGGAGGNAATCKN